MSYTFFYYFDTWRNLLNNNARDMTIHMKPCIHMAGLNDVDNNKNSTFSFIFRI